METTLIIQKLNRILKENNCYKSFYKNFYYNESRKWRTDEDKCGDTIIFQKWVKDVYEQRFNKFSYFYDILSEKNTYALILTLAFPWYNTDEGRDFWLLLREKIIEEYKNEKE